MMFAVEDIVRLVADAYHSAALASADMRATTDALESIRTELVTGSNPFDSWNLIDDRIGRAEPDRVRPCLIQLREAFKEILKVAETSRLADIFASDEKGGWFEWRRVYAAALAGWRWDFCLTLADIATSYASEYKADIDMTRILTQRAIDERWAEAFPLFHELGLSDAVSTAQRMELLVVAGEIELYHFRKPAQARQYFEQARALSPDHGRPSSAMGEYWLQQNDIEQARECCQRAIAQSPTLPEGYLYLGECSEKSADLVAAEAHYQDAIRHSPGTSKGYIWLLRLHGQTTVFSEHKDRIPRLVRDIAAIVPSDEYSSLIDAGYVYQQNQDYAEAHRWYDKAISKEPLRMNGYASKGYAYLDEAAYDQARDNFQKAIDVASETFEGYLGMGWLYEQQQDWEQAARYFEQSLQRRPEWGSFVLAKLGELYRQLGDYDKAEEKSMAALELEPTNQQIIGTLEGIAQDYYEKENNPDAALRIFNKLREIEGSGYEATYQNYIGNLRFYFGEYDQAAEAYRRASELGPTNAVYHSNVSLALERSSGPLHLKLAGALEALREACRLLPDAADYARRLQGLELRQRILKTYGDASLGFIPTVIPIGVGVEPALLPYFVDTNKSVLLSETVGLLGDLRRRMQERCGIQIPGVMFSALQDPGLAEGFYVFSLAEVFVVSGVAKPGEKFFEGASGIGQPDGRMFVDGLLKHLEQFLENNLADFVHHESVANMLAASTNPTCRQIKEFPNKLAALTITLRALVAEKVPLLSFDAICARFLELYSPTSSLLLITESLRSTPELRPLLPGNDKTHSFHQMDSQIEEELLSSIVVQDCQPVLILSTNSLQHILEAMKPLLERDERSALIIHNKELRPLACKVLKPYFPKVPVLSHSELLPELETKLEQEPAYELVR